MKQEKFIKTRKTIAYIMSGLFIVMLIVVSLMVVEENFGATGKINSAKQNLSSLSTLKTSEFVASEKEVQRNNGVFLEIEKTADILLVYEDVEKLEKWIQKNNFVSDESLGYCSLFNIFKERQGCGESPAIHIFSSSEEFLNQKLKKLSYYNSEKNIDLNIFFGADNSVATVVLHTEVLLKENEETV